MKTAIKKMRSMKFFPGLIIAVILAGSCEVADDLLGLNATVSKIVGEWTCDEDSEIYKSTTSVYSVAISPDPDNDFGVIIDNFYGISAAVYASVSGMSLIISNQTVSGGYEISGSGIISSGYDVINWNYTVDDGSGVIDHVTAVYTKN